MADFMLTMIGKKYRLILVIVLAVLLSSLIVLISAKYTLNSKDQKLAIDCDSLSSCPLSIPQKKQLIKQKLLSTSSQLVYEEIKKDFKDKKAAEQHEIAHLFGQTLYQTKGLNEIGNCDSNFAFGCFHGFFIEAISDKGINIVHELDQSCIRKFGKLGLGCQHGIGHGLMEYFGPKKLVQALQTCGQLDWQKPLLGCAGGVFMEYNLPLNESGISFARPFMATRPYGECYEVPDKFQQECFYNLGLWWNQVLQKDYGQILKLCSEIPEALLRERCLMGAGNAAATTSSLDIPQIKSYCDLAESSDGQTICRSGAAWVLYATPSTKKKAELLCADLSASQKAVCLDKTDLVNTF